MKEKHYRILKFVRDRQGVSRAGIRKECKCRTDDISDLLRAGFLSDPAGSDNLLITAAGAIQLKVAR